MSLVKLTAKVTSYSQTQNLVYALILNEVDGEKNCHCYWCFEAQSIAIALEKRNKTRKTFNPRFV